MAAQSPDGRRPLRRGRSLSVTVGLSALLAVACGPAARTEKQPLAPSEASTVSLRSAGTALLAAEGVDASFVAILAGVDVALKASSGASPAQAVALRRAAERAYREEGVVLREALLADAMVPADAPDAARILTVLAKARKAAAARPWTSDQTAALDRALVASPDRQGIVALSATMAASRFAGERALAARRMAWALDRARSIGARPSPSDAADQIADMIATTRRAEDAKGGAIAIGRDDPALVQALLTLPAAYIATLTAWYDSGEGKAARERLVGNFQGANDRAGRATLIDFLTREETGG